MDIVLVGYREADTLAAIRFCDSAFASSRFSRRVLVLNDAELAPIVAAEGRRWEIVAGSNSDAEFSGWQEGLDHLSASANGVVLVNDSVVTHRYFTRARQWALLRSVRQVRGDAIIGFVDRVPGDLAVAGMPLDGWVSSYCFALTAGALSAFRRALVDRRQIDRCVRGGTEKSAFFACLSPDLEVHLRHWIFGGGLHPAGWYAEGWYGGGEPTDENVHRLEVKARAVIAEMLLTARARRAGVAIVDPFERSPSLRRLDDFLVRLHNRIAKPDPSEPPPFDDAGHSTLSEDGEESVKARRRAPSSRLEA